MKKIWKNRQEMEKVISFVMLVSWPVYSTPTWRFSKRRLKSPVPLMRRPDGLGSGHPEDFSTETVGFIVTVMFSDFFLIFLIFLLKTSNHGTVFLALVVFFTEVFNFHGQKFGLQKVFFKLAYFHHCAVLHPWGKKIPWNFVTKRAPWWNVSIPEWSNTAGFFYRQPCLCRCRRGLKRFYGSQTALDKKEVPTRLVARQMYSSSLACPGGSDVWFFDRIIDFKQSQWTQCLFYGDVQKQWPTFFDQQYESSWFEGLIYTMDSHKWPTRVPDGIFTIVFFAVLAQGTNNHRNYFHGGKPDFSINQSINRSFSAFDLVLHGRFLMQTFLRSVYCFSKPLLSTFDFWIFDFFAFNVCLNASGKNETMTFVFWNVDVIQ